MNRAAPAVFALVLAAIGCGSPREASPDAPAASPDAAAAGDSAPPPVDAGPLGDPFAELRALPATCTTDNWCWRTPTPLGNDYSRVYSTGPDNLWLIGHHGTVMQWTGHAWAFHHPPVLPGTQQAQFPMAIGGLGPADMWLIYGTTLQHWDGAAWTILDSLPLNGFPAFNNLWVAPDGDAWVTVSDGTVRRWHNGVAQHLSACNGCFLGSIWGTASNDLFITTLPAGILHYDGEAFVRSYDGPLIAGSYQGTKDDVWVSGDSGLSAAMLHWNGATWTTVSTGLPPRWYVTGAAALASNDVWWWAYLSSATSALLHWDGTTITTTPVDTTSVGGFLYSASIIDGRWWFVGREGSVYTRSGPDTITPVVTGNAMSVLSMWGAADDDMYFASGGDIVHWDGAAMTSQPIRASTIGGVRTGGATELFAAGYDRAPNLVDFVINAYHYDGATWTKSELERGPYSALHPITKIFAIGPKEAMAVGVGGIAYWYASSQWRRVETGVTAELVDVWGPDPDHLWFTGPGGLLLAWNRANPLVAAPDPSFTSPGDNLGPIHGAGGITWIGVTNGSHVWRSSPTGWTAVPAGAVASGLFAVSATNVVVASSGQSRIARWNGTAFVPEDSGNGAPTPLLFQPPGGTMLAGGLGYGMLVQHP